MKKSFLHTCSMVLLGLLSSVALAYEGQCEKGSFDKGTFEINEVYSSVQDGLVRYRVKGCKKISFHSSGEMHLLNPEGKIEIVKTSGNDVELSRDGGSDPYSITIGVKPDELVAAFVPLNKKGNLRKGTRLFIGGFEKLFVDGVFYLQDGGGSYFHVIEPAPMQQYEKDEVATLRVVYGENLMNAKVQFFLMHQSNQIYNMVDENGAVLNEWLDLVDLYKFIAQPFPNACEGWYIYSYVIDRSAPDGLQQVIQNYSEVFWVRNDGVYGGECQNFVTYPK